MRRPAPSDFSVLLALGVCAGFLAATRAGGVVQDGRPFTLPDGFTIERVAGPPLVDRPIVADFDEQGRLYVADSSGSNDPVQKQLAEKPHRILRLEDIDGDGIFDRRTVFADQMMFPEGVMWLDGSLYVAAPPSIWKLTDADGDGVAETREEWFQGKTLTGCANDLHGPYAGLDGWVYWCKGAFAEQTYERPGKKPFVTKASHIFRCRPDGSGIEPVMTGGMDNPVDVVFTPGGERVFTTTFLVNPGNGQRDGLIHAIYGGVYGKVHGVIDGHPRTGPEVMPPLVHLGAAAPCGLTTYQGDAFGSAYLDNLFACCFNMQKVTRHVLTTSGGAFASKDEDFLVSTDRDFHPTDIVEDADGSLLVVDTGGWYKLCCPTSQLPKPDVLGAIYRVRKIGSKGHDDPRGLKIDWKATAPKALTLLLDDSRPAVRRRAIATLGQRGDSAVPALAEAVVSAKKTPEARRNAVWAATRIDGAPARAVARAALGDLDETVRQVAAHSASVRRDHDALPRLIALLLGPSPQNRRVAAEALGRLGDPSALPALLAAAGGPADRALEHSLIYALIEIGDPKATATSLANTHPSTRRAALVALDQMEGGALAASQVSPGLASTDPLDREIASWIVGRHPEWAGALAGFLKDRLAGASKLSEADRSALAGQLARFSASPEVQKLLAEPLAGAPLLGDVQKVALRAMRQSGLKAVPASWVVGLDFVLQNHDDAGLPEALDTARALSTAVPKADAPALAKTLIELARDEKLPPASRLDALAAVPGGLSAATPEIFAFLLHELDPKNAVSVRTGAADVLSRASLSTAQLLALADAVKAAGPLEVDRLLSAFEKSTDDAVGRKLVAAVKGSSAFASLRVDMLKPRFDKFGPSVRAQADEIYARLNVNAAEQKARLEAMLPTLNDGDVRRGQAVFNGTKAGCITCHAVGYLGGKVGPDLSQIGKVRTDRDLMESILFPSLSFVRSYEPVTVATKDGKVLNGLLQKDSADEIVLTVNATEHTHIARASIDELRPGTVSVMPAGLDQQLSRQELADLLAFLKSRK